MREPAWGPGKGHKILRRRCLPSAAGALSQATHLSRGLRTSPHWFRPREGCPVKVLALTYPRAWLRPVPMHPAQLRHSGSVNGAAQASEGLQLRDGVQTAVAKISIECHAPVGRQARYQGGQLAPTSTWQPAASVGARMPQPLWLGKQAEHESVLFSSNIQTTSSPEPPTAPCPTG